MTQERWELLADLLDEDIYMRNVGEGQPGMVPFTDLAQPVVLLGDLNLSLNTPSQHAALLKDRHTSGVLAQLVPIPQFADADFLLYLRGQLQGDEPSGMRWLPWGTSQVYHPPRYLLQASNTRYAQQLLRPLGVDDIESLKQRLVVCQANFEQ